MPALATDFFTEVGNPGTATTLAAPGHTIAGTTFNVVSTSNWPTATGVFFAVDTLDVATGLRVPGTYTVWEGVVASATQITGAVLRYGTDQNYPAGSTSRVYISIAGSRENRLVQGLLVSHEQSGALKTAAVQSALGLTNLNGYTPVGYAPNTVTANGNRSYDMVFNGQDLTSFLSPGMRLRTTRTVAAPTQSASLNGTNQYFSKTSPVSMTFVDDFVVSAWVKLTSYPASDAMIATRSDNINGWFFGINATGQLILNGTNGAAGNYNRVVSYQSLPLNKWVHVAAQLDMSSATVTGGTANYTMIDGVDVPCSKATSGTNPTAMGTQAGSLYIGAYMTPANYWPGKIAQVAIFSAKVTQATIKASMNQGLTGSETNLISAYSLSNSLNDLNTTNANNLTANGSAVATNADSPFGGQADGTISSTLDYAIVQSVSFSTNTTVVVQVPEGCTIPTSGGVSAVVYSSNKSPYGFPTQRGKWRVQMLNKLFSLQSSPVSGTWYNINSQQLSVPVGDWSLKHEVSLYGGRGAAGQCSAFVTLSGTATTEDDLEFTAQGFVPASTENLVPATREKDVSVTTAKTYYLNNRTDVTGMTSVGLVGSSSTTKVIAENAFL